MSQRLPVSVVAEYRGSKQASKFTKRDTGEVVDVAEKLKFEYVWDDGEPDVIEVAITALDRATPPFDAGKLKKGDMVRLVGEAVIQDRGVIDKNSYFSLRSCVALTAAELKAA